MNMEGYGPIATGMGGASMTYDNGNAAMMNNPATLDLMAEGDRAEVFFGVLGPDVEAKTMGVTVHSHGTCLLYGGWRMGQERGPFCLQTGVFGYAFSDRQGIDFSVVDVFENSQTNPVNGSTIPPVESRHSQLNFQFLYTYLF